MSDDTPPPIGHNKPPAPLTPAEIRAFLADEHSEVLKRRDRLLIGVANFKERFPVITNEEDQGKAAAFVDQIRAHAKIAEDLRVPAKNPFLEGGRAVDAFFKAGIIDPLQVGINEVRAPMTAYAKRVAAERLAAAQREAVEARRIADLRAAELAEQERIRLSAETPEEAHIADAPPTVTYDEAIGAEKDAEKAEKAAAGRPADFSRTRSDLGAVASLREFVVLTVVDIGLVPREFLLFNESAAKRAVRGGLKSIPGVTITPDSHIGVR